MNYIIHEAFEFAPDAMVVIGSDGLIVAANSQTCVMFGRDREWLIGQFIEVLLPERYRERHITHRNRYMESPKLRPMGTGISLYGLHRDGQEIPVDVMLSPLSKGTFFLATVRDITEWRKVEAQLRVSLQEIHHRVKNNLQVISSLLRLQAGNDETLQEAFTDSQNRIQAMALVHETLYQSQNLAQIDFDRYIYRFTRYLCGSFGLSPQVIQQDIQGIILDLDSSISFGLIINELVSNSFKHAWGDDTKERVIEIMMSQDSDNICLIVKDNGKGLPMGFSFERTNTLGLQLVYSLVTDEMDGAISHENSDGAVFTIIVPKTV